MSSVDCLTPPAPQIQFCVGTVVCAGKKLKDQPLGEVQLNVSDVRKSNFLQSASKRLSLMVNLANYNRRLPFLDPSGAARVSIFF